MKAMSRRELARRDWSQCQELLVIEDFFIPDVVWCVVFAFLSFAAHYRGIVPLESLATIKGGISKVQKPSVPFFSLLFLAFSIWALRPNAFARLGSFVN